MLISMTHNNDECSVHRIVTQPRDVRDIHPRQLTIEIGLTIFMAYQEFMRCDDRTAWLAWRRASGRANGRYLLHSQIKRINKFRKLG